MRNGAAISVISARVSMRVCHSVCVCKREALSVHVCVGSFQLAVAERLGASVCQRVTEMMIKNGSHSCSCCRCYVHWHVPKGDRARGRWRAEEKGKGRVRGRVSVCEFDLVAVPEARQLLEYS